MPSTRHYSTAATILSLALASCGESSEPVAMPNESVAVANVETIEPAPPAENAAAPAVAAPALSVDAEGLRLIDRTSGRTRPIPFGTARADTLAALAFLGTAEIGTNAECGAGPLGWAQLANGLTLQFQDERFAGWSVDGKAAGKVTTMAGIGPGSTRAALDDAYAITLPESTLGTEFAAGEMGGLLDGPAKSAKITDLWAGVTCHFR